jgi:hypothetical protein
MAGRRPDDDGPPTALESVLAGERLEIAERRRRHYADEPGRPAAPAAHDMVGLALSGGGIRSATFCVGLLQGLERLRLLRIFDYLSTVSGGGFAGGWWGAWLARGALQARSLTQLEATIGPEAAQAVLVTAAAGPCAVPPRSDRVFPGPEQTDPERAPHYVDDRVPDGAMAAGADPIHHLRLFSNYLTPRKGLLSGDTWRAITVVTRNLAMTWLVLIPVLLAAILLGQLYFVWQDFVPGVGTEFISTTAAAPVPGVAAPAAAVAAQNRAKALGKRAAAALTLLTALALVQAVLTTLWMHYNNDGTPGTQGAALGVVLLMLGALAFMTGAEPLAECDGFWSCLSQWTWLRWSPWDTRLAGLTFVALLLLLAAFWLPARPASGGRPGPRKQIQGNRATQWHARAMTAFVATAAVLLFAGFAHEGVAALAGELGRLSVTGVAAVVTTLGTVGGALHAALRAAPSAAGEAPADASSSRLTGLVFALTPTLVLVLLAGLGASATHALLGWLARWPGADVRLGLLTFLVFAGIGLCLLFAAYEAERPDRTRTGRRRWLLTIATGSVSCLALLWASRTTLDLTAVNLQAEVGYLIAATLVADVLVLVGLVWPAGSSRRLRWTYRSLAAGGVLATAWHAVGLARTGGRVDWAIVLAFGACLVALYHVAGGQERPRRPLAHGALGLVVPVTAVTHWVALDGGGRGLAGPFLLTLLAALLLLGFVARRRPTTARRVLILTFACVVGLLSLFLTAAQLQAQLGGLRLDDALRLGLKEESIRSAVVLYAATCAAVLAAAWAVALGWMADPNALSLHTFYRARLVRSYLGASNWRRHRGGRGITEPTEGDDVPLKDLHTCAYGGPYHLVNTTLNLVGGRDLSTAQRSAAAFVLSRRHCGSVRTGYRETSQYMDGELTLGAAIAASGAAVSPNMGARSPSAALSMLLAFLNVRLGFWAPTPHRAHWRQPQARLWPYYLLWEMFSQTNDLNSYCYLTDGGHFDNTGLYALVERGCRHVVVVDNGADPGPRFEDLGDAIRRCRIDFGVEIALDVAGLQRSAGVARRHCAVGTITYTEPHTTLLGWGGGVHEGVIVWIKPTVVAGDPADVRQYGLQQTVFPQQSTADQWFDEAQFESYRKLGEFCATSLFGRPARAVFGDPAATPLPPLTPGRVAKLFEGVRDAEERRRV